MIPWRRHIVGPERYWRAVNPVRVNVSLVAGAYLAAGIVVASLTGTGQSVPGSPGLSSVDTIDTDGDRLPDAAERDPDGAGEFLLRNASPDRKDLYVVVLVGGDSEPLTERERADLRAVFAAMPVRNPDWTTGVDSTSLSETPPAPIGSGPTTVGMAPRGVPTTPDRPGTVCCPLDGPR